MNETSGQPESARAKAISFRATEIRALAPGLLLAAAVALYLGFQWGVDWPTSVSEAEQQRWKATDLWFRLLLKVLGGLFVVAAAVCGIGTRYGALAACIAEACFGVLLLAMVGEGLLEWRLSGGPMELFAILLFALGLFSLFHALGAWRIYTVKLTREEAAA
jgi:hypothetical protein